MKMLRPVPFLPRLPIVAAIGLILSLPAGAQSLVDLHAAARAFDASYQSARSSLEAAQAKAAQARAPL